VLLLYGFSRPKKDHALPPLSFELAEIRLQQLRINALADAEEYEGSRVANLSSICALPIDLGAE
jgi:hypothetical protein